MWPFKRKHKCSFDKPVASAYVSFNTRDILFECSCGKRVIERVCNDFSKPFPIGTTTFLTRKDLEKMVSTAEIFAR